MLASLAMLCVLMCHDSFISGFPVLYVPDFGKELTDDIYRQLSAASEARLQPLSILFLIKSLCKARLVGMSLSDS